MNAHARTLTDADIRYSPSSFPKMHQAQMTPARVWEKEVLASLTKFYSLEPGWDGANGVPLKWDAGMFALHILTKIMRFRTPCPQVVPTSVGGVQLEWHEKGIDLELHVTGPFECEMWFMDHRNVDAGGISAEITNNFSPLVTPINLLETR